MVLRAQSRNSAAAKNAVFKSVGDGPAERKF